MASINDTLSQMVELAAQNQAGQASMEADEVLSEDSIQEIPTCSNMQSIRVEQDFGSNRNIVYFTDSYGSQRKVSKELEKLQFSNPGGRNDFSRVYQQAKRTRKMAQPGDKNGKAKSLYHDRKGRLIIQSGDAVCLCDCLQTDCHGCHWPCATCKGSYCGPICQRDRFRVVTCVNEQGFDINHNPFVNRKR